MNFSEEIPARMQARAAEDLRRLVTGALGWVRPLHAILTTFVQGGSWMIGFC